MKRQFTYIFALAAFLLAAGCQKEGLETENGYGEAVVRFAPSIASIGGGNGLTKSDAGCGNQAELTLSSSDGSLTLPMTCETIEGIDLGSASSQASDSIATKGSLINGNGGITDAGFAGAIANTFWVTAWDNAATPSRIIPDQVLSGYTTADGKYQKVMYRTKDVSGKTLSVPYWMTMQPQTVSGASEPADDEYIWTKDEVKTFYAYANLPESGASVTNTSAAGQTLTYDVPATAAAQTDILMGFYSGNGNSGSPAVMTGTAGIVFSHPLTAVIFKAGDLNGAKINSISIEGVYASGTAEMTPESAAESDAKDRVIWTPSTTEPTTTTVSQTISTQPAAAGDHIGEAFLLIPQDFTGNTSALIVIDVTFGGTRQNIYCPLDGQNWKAGYTYNYLINYDNNGYVLFDAPTQHTVKLAITGTMPDCTIEYSTDARTWNEYTIGTDINFGGPDGKVLFRGTNNSTALDGSNYHHFVFDDGADGTAADVIVSGNAMGLLDKSLANVATWTKGYMLFALFYGCKPLKDAGSLLLPMTKLSSQNGYAYMFYGCSNLRTAPELPATTLASACYSCMFEGCSSLERAPQLPFVRVQPYACKNMYKDCTSLTYCPDFVFNQVDICGCQGMFMGCTSLKKGPSFPYVTKNSTQSFKDMFSGCTSLEEAPDLLATTLSSTYTYDSMFKGCISLKKTPAVLATNVTTGCFQSMFYGCTSLTKAPELLATTLASSCYSSMFSGCTSLVDAPVLPATTLAESCYNSMFSGCTSLVDAPELLATTLASKCYYGMFHGCTSLVDAPELLATTLASNCCSQMFYGCTSLVDAPELPATTLANSCYSSMFRACSNLVNAPVLPASILAASCYYEMLLGCSKVSELTILATDISASNVFNNFIGSGTRTFYYNPSLGTPDEAKALFKEKYVPFGACTFIPYTE